MRGPGGTTLAPPNTLYNGFLCWQRTNDVAVSLTKLWRAHTVKLGYQSQDSLKVQNLGTADFHRDDVAAMLAGDPDAALSFYMRVRAENVKVQRELEQAGHANPEVGADRILQARALQMIKADMGRHLAMTIPLIYRGATVSFAFLVFALGYCLLRRDYALSLFIVPALALLGLYALLSNVFITRYELPALPVATVVAFALLHSFWRTSRMPHRIDATSAG